MEEQKYDIKYPFTSENDDGVFLDMNSTYGEEIKSKVLHVLFTPKGQKLRDPEFGTDLIKYIFSPKDSSTFNELKAEITGQIMKHVPAVEFKDITIYDSETSEHGIVVMVEYGIKRGNKTDITTVAVKI